MDAFIFFVFGALTLAGALGVVLARNPVHSALLARRHAGERRGAVHPAGRPAARRGAGDRLRRRHRRAVPVRDHAARRRPARARSRDPLQAPARRCASSSALVLLAEVLFLTGHHWATGAHRRRRATRSAAAPRARQQRRTGRALAVHRLPLAVRDHRGAARARGRRLRRARPAQPPAPDERAWREDRS